MGEDSVKLHVLLKIPTSLTATGNRPGASDNGFNQDISQSCSTWLVIAARLSLSGNRSETMYPVSA